MEEQIQIINAQWLDIEKLEFNNGQIEGVPANPRKISPKKFGILKRSIQEDPEMLGMRELLVYPMDNDKYVVIGGNMRLKAMKKLGFEKALCKVLPVMSAEKLASIAVKDNGNVGVWDIDITQDGWNLELLKDWGVSIKKDDEEGEENGDIPFSEILNEEHNYVVLYFDNEVDWLQLCSLLGLETVKSGSTRQDGVLSNKMVRSGVGRVLKGAEAINKLLGNK